MTEANACPFLIHNISKVISSFKLENVFVQIKCRWYNGQGFLRN